MDEQKLMLAQEELKAKLEIIVSRRGDAGALELARLANLPYDAELPIPPVIEKVCKVVRVEKGEYYEYFVISPETKTVYTIINGAVTQVNIAPTTENKADFNSYNGPAENVYIEKLMEAKYDPIALKAKAINEALNRKEIKDVLDVMIASATAQSNVFAPSTGTTGLMFPKVLEMIQAINKFGTKFVLIVGSNVATDVILMNYNANKNQPVKLSDLGVEEVIAVNNFQYTHSSTQTVLNPNTAILVALSDAADERPVHFVRRKIADIVSGGNDKERIIVGSGPRMSVGADPKWAYEIAIMEQYAVVQPNPYAVAIFERE